MNSSRHCPCRHRGRGPRGRDALAQDASQFPSRNIHIVVPNAAGGGLDFFARLVGGKLSDRLGKPVVVENRAGANGNLAAGQVMKAAARRPHAAAGLDRHAHRQSGRGREPHLRHAPRFRADLDDRQISADPDGERPGAGRRPCRSSSPMPRPIPAKANAAAIGPDLPGGAEDVRAAHRHDVPVHRLSAPIRRR